MLEMLGYLAVTVLGYSLADRLYRKAGQFPLLHPVLLPSLGLIAILLGFGGDHTTFEQAMLPLDILLMAATAALAVPLYRHRNAIKRDPVAALAAIIGGSIAGTGSAVSVAFYLEAMDPVTASLFTKSVTTPIALDLMPILGGIPAIAATVIILSGVFVAIAGPFLLRLIQIDDELVVGLAMGTAGHGLGMAEAVRRSDLMGASAAFAMALNGLLTAAALTAYFAIFG